MNPRQENLIRAVDALGPFAAEFCAGLVRINSVNPHAGGPPGGENAGQAVLARELKALGFQVELFETPPGIYEKAGVLGPRDREHRGRLNLVGRLNLPRPGRTIVLNGHMDTVGVKDMTIAPFGGEIRDGRIWGRGAADCKGSLTGGLTAVKALLQAGGAEAGAIIFQSVTDEECSGAGAGTLACCLAGHKGDACILLDGSIERIAAGCMGIVTGNISVTGQGGHAARRDAVSALDLACLVKDELDAVRRERLDAHTDNSFCIGEFHAGDAPWNVPAAAWIGFNMSYPFAEACRSETERGRFGGNLAMEQVERALARAAERHACLRSYPPKLEWIKDLWPFQTDMDTPVVREMAAAYRLAAERAAPIGIDPGWSDGAWLTRLGGMLTAALGAGRDAAAHSPDESALVEDILLQAKVVALTLSAMLAIP